MLEIKVTKAAGQNACEEQATADVKGILRRRKREQTLWLARGSRDLHTWIHRECKCFIQLGDDADCDDKHVMNIRGCAKTDPHL